MHTLRDTQYRIQQHACTAALLIFQCMSGNIRHTNFRLNTGNVAYK